MKPPRILSTSVFIILTGLFLLFSNLPPSFAAGKVYGTDQLRVCRKLALVPGVYEVWCEPNPPLGELEFQVVLKQNVTSAQIQIVSLALESARKRAGLVNGYPKDDVNIWTYKSLASMDSVERAIASAYSWPDNRGRQVAAVSTNNERTGNEADRTWHLYFISYADQSQMTQQN